MRVQHFDHVAELVRIGERAADQGRGRLAGERVVADADAGIGGPDVALDGAPARDRADLGGAENLEHARVPTLFGDSGHIGEQRRRGGDDARERRQFDRGLQQGADLQGRGDQHARLGHGAQGGCYILGIEGRAAPGGGRRMQRQQHGRLEPVHVVRRHHAHDAGRGARGHAETGRGIDAAFRQRAPEFVMGNRLARAARGEDDRRKPGGGDLRILLLTGVPSRLLRPEQMMTERAGLRRVVGQRVEPGIALRQCAQSVGCALAGQQADLAPQHGGGQRSGEVQPIVAQVHHVRASRQLVRQPACHGQEHRGRDDTVFQPEYRFVRRASGQAERRGGVCHVTASSDSMGVDVVGQAAQRLKYVVRAGIVGLEFEPVGPGYRQRDFQRIDRIESQPVAEQRFIRLDVPRRHFEVEHIHQ